MYNVRIYKMYDISYIDELLSITNMFSFVKFEKEI